MDNNISADQARSQLNAANSRNEVRDAADNHFNSGTGYSSLIDQGYKLDGGKLYPPGSRLGTDVAGNTIEE